MSDPTYSLYFSDGCLEHDNIKTVVHQTYDAQTNSSSWEFEINKYHDKNKLPPNYPDHNHDGNSFLYEDDQPPKDLPFRWNLHSIDFEPNIFDSVNSLRIRYYYKDAKHL